MMVATGTPDQGSCRCGAGAAVVLPQRLQRPRGHNGVPLSSVPALPKKIVQEMHVTEGKGRDRAPGLTSVAWGVGRG